MKKTELLFTTVLVPLDFLVVFCAALSAYGLRYNWLSDFRPFTLTIPIEDYVLFAVMWALVFLVCFAMSGLYTIGSARKLKYELSRVFLASSAAAMFAIALIFFRGELFASRFIVLAAWLFSMFGVAFGHTIVRLVQRNLLHHGIGVRRVVVIGGKDHTTTLLTKELEGNPGFGYLIVATVPSFSETSKRKIAALRDARGVDDIIVTNPNIDREELGEILSFAESRQMTFSYAADLVATYGRNIDIGAYAGIPLVTVKGTRLEGWGRVYKRLFDIVASLMLIILTLPIMILAAIAIVIDNGFPILFWGKQGSSVIRAGENGVPFMFVKFRSMINNADEQRYKELRHLDEGKEGPIVKIKNDPRVTRVGAFIRATSIDELPQLFLVLFGTMSLVGPRPHAMEEVSKYKDHHRRVLAVKPGITGMAQISGRRDLSFEDEVRLDTYYIENWSLWLDLAILLKTPFAVFRKKGAY